MGGVKFNKRNNRNRELDIQEFKDGSIGGRKLC